MLLRYVPLVVLVCLLTACGAEPRAEVGPRLFLAGDGELWVVDARAGKVRHLARSQLGLGDQPRRILARGNHLVMGAAYGDSAYFLRSAHRDRVWVVDVSARTALVSAVREVTVDGETTVAAVRPPGRQRPLAAVSDGLLFAAHGGVDVWDPATQRVVRHLRVNPSDLGPADRDVVTECAAACAVLRLIDVDTGAAREVRAPSGYRFEPWSAQFSSANRLLGIVVRGARRRRRSAPARPGRHRQGARRRRARLARPARLHARRLVGVVEVRLHHGWGPICPSRDRRIPRGHAARASDRRRGRGLLRPRGYLALRSP